MTSYAKQGQRPEVGRYFGFDHLVFWVGNAKQAATYYITRFGFEPIAYSGLETGSRSIVSHAVRQVKITFVFQSPLIPFKEGKAILGKENKSTLSSPDEQDLSTLQQMYSHLVQHGDGVRDVAFTVDNARGIYEKAMSRGARSIRAPWTVSDANGSVTMATIATYGNTVHTFVERHAYKGLFLPGFVPVTFVDPLKALLPGTGLVFVDHCVGNQADLEMQAACELYEKQLDFQRFWSVDDKQIHTEYSALRSIVMTDFDETVKLPINEPAPGKKKSQIQEFVDYYGGAGVQHIALNTNDIIKAVEALRARGTEFLTIPKAYYDNLRLRLASPSSIKVHEDLATLERLHILVDFDENGYLLQIFTKPVEDRPTLFIEIIQRHNNTGFGAGNFKALFESIEIEQDKRGNL